MSVDGGVEWSGNYRNLCQGSGKKSLTMTKESLTHIRNRYMTHRVRAIEVAIFCESGESDL
jgi:hypothetical protein